MLRDVGHVYAHGHVVLLIERADELHGIVRHIGKDVGRLGDERPTFVFLEIECLFLNVDFQDAAARIDRFADHGLQGAEDLREVGDRQESEAGKLVAVGLENEPAGPGLVESFERGGGGAVLDGRLEHLLQGGARQAAEKFGVGDDFVVAGHGERDHRSCRGLRVLSGRLLLCEAGAWGNGQSRQRYSREQGFFHDHDQISFATARSRCVSSGIHFIWVG